MNIKQLKHRIPITRLLGINHPSRYYASEWVSILCPFHLDHNPSAAYNTRYGKFVCYAGCTDGGTWDIIDIAKAETGLEDTREVIKWLEERYLGDTISTS